ncbi:pentapeptide repeat-containing protein [Pontivivens insulae]|uniref:Pentapeptide repeat-containing protein n=1 Tax=Pontivivens insulae TaxID=1639689 RepID=A0A2R8ACX8_9RHOB|nr:pentapeptide repeat-containing protein [Pontivivens insulae]RED13824.1 pentapeptide repeat protein [Pontivivens insulae]SPF29898.1 hypothetical protein POI8812_02223 [Pontivivens insulae]
MTENANPFNGKQLQGTHFERADMTGAHFDGVKLDDARLWTLMRNASVEESNLQGCRFDDVNLAEATYENVNLSGARFNNINFTNATITDANLSGMRIDGILVTDLLAAYEARQD